MIRNVALKRFLVDNIFPVFSLVNKFTRKKENQIFLYCAANGDLSDNSEALFDYMVANNYNRKYRIVCGVNDPSQYKDHIIQNISFVPKRQCIKEYLRSKYVFYSFGKLPIKPTKDQCVINLWHGMPIKAIGKLSNAINNGEEFFFSFVCATSKMFKPIMAKSFGCPEENVCICGEPKTDRLFEEKKDMSEKLIVWTPTFRQSAFYGYNDSDTLQFLPLFEQGQWEELNQVLYDNHVRLIVKLHPAQDVGTFTHCDLGNLSIYSEAYFLEQGRNLYSLLAQSDALVADYSSVYLEYLMLNRPICFMLGDVEEYSQKRGFSFKNPLELMPGEHVRDKQDLYKFIRDVANGRDPHKQKRENVRDLVHQYKDNKNCKRILDIAGIEV